MDLWWSSSASPAQGRIAKAGCPRAYFGFEYIEEWRLHNLLRQPNLVFHLPHSLSLYMYSLQLKWKFLHFTLSLVLLVLSLGITGKSPAPSSLVTLTRPPWTLLFSRLNSYSSLSLFKSCSCSSPLIIFAACCWTHSSMSMSPLY